MRDAHWGRGTTTMTTKPMIRVLGPIDVVTADGIGSVGGRRPRALLGALVVSAGHAVGVDQLADVIWGQDPPATAGNTLQSHVSDLRRVLGHEAIHTIDHSYELDVDAVDVDALEFQRTLRRADAAENDPAERWRLCGEALAHWRGRPFGDLADDEAFALEVHRLDELRLVAIELGLEAEIALGHHELVVGELESAVEEYPYRERLWLLLVKALALDDRRVEALRACSRLRRILGDVGLEIGDELARLEQQILLGHSPRPTEGHGGPQA